MSADLQDLHAAVEVGGADQCDAAALQGYGLHLHAVGYNGNGFVAGFMSDASLSPVLLKLQITHMQNTAEKHVAFPGAGRSHDRDNLSTVFPELLRTDKDVAKLRERDRLSGISRIYDHGDAGVAREEISGEERDSQKSSHHRQHFSAAEHFHSLKKSEPRHDVLWLRLVVISSIGRAAPSACLPAELPGLE